VILLTFFYAVKLNGNRKVMGVMRGFDQFMNIVLDETIEDAGPERQTPLGMVVSDFMFVCITPSFSFCR